MLELVKPINFDISAESATGRNDSLFVAAPVISAVVGEYTLVRAMASEPPIHQRLAVVTPLSEANPDQDSSHGRGNGCDGGNGEDGPERPNRALLIQAIHAFADGPKGRQWMAETEVNIATSAAQHLHDNSWLASDDRPLGRELGYVGNASIESENTFLSFEGTYLNNEAERLADALAEFEERPASTTLFFGLYPPRENTHEPENEVVHSLEIFLSIPKDGPIEWTIRAIPESLTYTTQMQRFMSELGLTEFKHHAKTESDFLLDFQKEEAILRRVNVFIRRHLGPFLSS